jgi:transposase
MTTQNPPQQHPVYNFLPQTIDELVEENRRLHEENNGLREENHRLLDENSKLREENEGLKKSAIDHQKRLLLYENPNTPPSKRIIYPKPKRQSGSPRYPGNPRGHRGVTRRKPEPDITLEPPRRERCTCGACLGEPGIVGSRVVEEISNPSPRQVIQYLEYEYDCLECGARLSSVHPDCPPTGRLGKNVCVQTTLFKYVDRLPHRKAADTLERVYGLKVSPATVLEITRRVAEWLRPEYHEAVKRVRESPVVYVDETGLKVDGVNHWVWCFTTDVDTVYAVRDSRGICVLREVLGKKYKGVIVCDGWRSYPCYTDRIQRCWAHLLREARYLGDKFEEAKPLSDGLGNLYASLSVYSVGKPPPMTASLLVEESEALVLRLTGGAYSEERVVRFVNKVMNALGGLFTFLRVDGVRPTNNRAERALREVVVQRKIVGGLRNEKGMMINETLMSLLATWKQRGLPLQETLANTLTKQWTKS